MADQNNDILSDSFQEIVIDFGDVCRFCLSETQNGISINDKCVPKESRESDAESVCNFISKLGIVEMEGLDNLPTKVCDNCYKMINLFYNFSQVCQKSDNLLRKCYENTVEETKFQLNFTMNTNSDVKVQLSENKFPQIVQFDVNDTNQLNNFSQIDIIQNQRENLNFLSERDNPIEMSNELILSESSKSVIKYEELVTYHVNNDDTITSQSPASFGLKKLKKGIRYKCKSCVESFTDVEKLKEHFKKIHKTDSDIANDNLKDERKESIEKKNFVCFHCEPVNQFQSENEYLEHLEECHEKKQGKGNRTVFCCVLCTFAKFPTRLSLSQHLVTVHKLKECDIVWNDLESKNPQICVNVNQEKRKVVNVINTSQGEVEKRESVIESSWNCPECNASYSRKQSLHCHLKEKHNHINPGGTKCPECSESFHTNRRLIQHGIKVHQKYFALFHHVFKKVLHPTAEENREKSFECDLCRRKYIYKTSLRKHILAAHLGKSAKDAVTCSHCGKTLSNKLNLKSHIEFVHEALFVSCPICKKKINFKTIGRHYKTHTTNADVFPGNNHLCNLCGKTLKTKRSFQDHQKLHQNIRDEICDMCGSGFTTKKLLKLHKKTHEGRTRKMFACDKCEKVFSGRHTLNRHILTHSGKKNFICEICSKCFYTIQELNRHVRHHKKDYKFDCQLCDMRFLCKSSFRHHMMKHRNVRPHKCQFCGKMFIQRAKMNLHMAAKHNVDVRNTKTVWKDPQTYVSLDQLL